MRDIFRPSKQPARAIYDAFQKEAENRGGVDDNDWIERERMAVWRTAREKALELRMRIPSMEEIEKAELLACGHCDYAAKWAYGVADAMLKR